MVELQPREYEALVSVLGGGRRGEDELDRVAEQCDSTAAFWRYLNSSLMPAEQRQLTALLSRPLEAT